ncbi:TetR/AcrR family transcriptional regulator [Cryptosporangium aurantiacum]|uniref:Transcriptional regulator, TetR family n=1 Tax=Cryptosporangium aurantiacum TaxID=134849 RepID=A0A1M7RB39_9ACTN|nr:TetR/AcrR family transcriptional regulator [Cryptosporangium aurantiacum]SHN43342.1 transcriptional regulator, TetR family [Cryptosporangium aurantiacum]
MRRIAGPGAKNRDVLLDAAERLMLEEGHAAVTSRRVARAAGLKPQLVHYYFRTMDDLFLAVFRRRAEAGLRRQAEALASPEPLRALWEFSTDTAGTALTMEFMGLASHHETIRAEIGRYAEQFRTAQVEALTGVLERAGVPAEVLPPAALALLLSSIARTTVMERAIGMSTGHDEILALVAKHLTALEHRPSSTPR